MSSSLKGLTVLASFAVQPVASETESERYFDNHYNYIKTDPREVSFLLPGIIDMREATCGK